MKAILRSDQLGEGKVEPATILQPIPFSRLELDNQFCTST